MKPSGTTLPEPLAGRADRPAPRRGLLKPLLVAACSILIILALAEALLRWQIRGIPLPATPSYPGQYQTNVGWNFAVDAEVGWRMLPNHSFKWVVDGERDTYSSDADGFRFDPQRGAAQDRACRTVLVGDSFTYGVGVEYPETFGARLEQKFESVSVRNLGMPSLGVDQMWMSVRHQALPMQPDLIIVGFIDLDFDRSLTAYRWDGGWNGGFNKPTFQLEGGRLRPQVAEDAPGFLGRKIAGLSLTRLFDFWSRRASRQWPVGKLWHRNAAILQELLADCRAADTAVLFVRLPSKDRAAFPQLARFMEEEGANYLDLGVAFPAKIHFRKDSHINVDGHRWVADSIGEWLAAHSELAREIRFQ